MKIVSTTDLSDYGNDCYINKSVTLIEEFGMYTVITCKRVTGWSTYEDIYCTSPTTDVYKAQLLYKEAGGIINE